MSELEFVETHVHLWDLGHPKVTYDWLGPDAEFPRVGPDFDGLKRDYLADDFIAETRAANVTKAVHVQAALGTADPVDETEWLQAESDRTGFPHAAVVYVDLGQPSGAGGARAAPAVPADPRRAGLLRRRQPRRAGVQEGLQTPGAVRPRGLDERQDAAHGGRARPGSQVPARPGRHRPLRPSGEPHGRVLSGVARGDEHGGRGRERLLQDLGPRHGRLELDGRVDQALGAALHRRVRTVPVRLRHQLAGRQALQQLRHAGRRLQRAGGRLQPRRAEAAMFSRNAERLYRI